MKHLDLFSGIGGFSIAAQRVGWETIGFSEIDPYCLDLLERRFDCDGWFSLPGSLDCWPPGWAERVTELSRIDPDWIVIENVYQTWRRWVPELRRRMYQLGYSSLPLRVRAVDVGRPHIRARGFLVANTDCERLREFKGWWRREAGEVAAELAFDGAELYLAYPNGVRELQPEGGQQKERGRASDSSWWAVEPSVGRVAHGVPNRVDRLKGLGNAVVPQAVELIFRGINHCA